jgi:hypothetical protein
MAILMILDWRGVTTEDYDRVNDAAGIHSDADAPEGLIAHTAAVDDDGELIVADVWESEEALGRFVETRLAPALRELDLPAPAPRVLPVHNRVRGTAAEPGMLLVIELPGADAEAYDRMTAAMPAHVTAGAHPAHDHVVAVDGTTLVVVDVWPSPEAFGTFAEEQVGPAAERAGLDLRSMRQRTASVHSRIQGRQPAQT